jgi:hypothetical protein
MLMRLSQAKVTIYGFTSQPVVSTIPSGWKLITNTTPIIFLI